MAKTALRKGLIALLAMAVAVAFVGGTLVLVLDLGTETEEAGPPLIVPTTRPGAQVTPGTEDPPADDSWRRPEGGAGFLALPAMGIPSVDFEWTIGELLTSVGGGTWLSQLFVVDGELWAAGGRYDEAAGRERPVVYTSSDGLTWHPKELPQAMTEAGFASFTVVDGGVVATVNEWDEGSGRSRLRVFISPDGASWSEADLSSLVGPDEQMWVNQVAGSDGVILLAGARERVPDTGWAPVVVTIEVDGYVIELAEASWTYTVTDVATSEVVSQGSQDRIWAHQADPEVGIYDPATNELVFGLDWNTLGRAGSSAYEAAQWGERLMLGVTSGDRTLTLDVFAGTLAVTDAAGAVLYEGTEQDLFQGPPPTFRSDATGEVVVVVPWQVWNDAHLAAHPQVPVDAHYSTPVLGRSVDGGPFAAVDLSSIAVPGFFFQALAAGPDGFLAVGSVEPFFEDHPVGEYEPSVPIVLTSRDGLGWTKVSTDLPAGAWLNSITVDDGGYVAVVGDLEGSRVATSGDGGRWRTVLSVADLQLELGTAWFDRLGVGGPGTFVTGSYDGYQPTDPQTATVSRNGRTLTIDVPVFTLTDDATGEVLATFDESLHYEGAAPGPAEPGFRWGQGGLAVFAEDGTVLFAVSQQQFEEAMATVWAEPTVYYQTEQMLLYRDGGQWARVTLPELGRNVWLGGMVVTDTSVVVIATSETDTGGVFTSSHMALVGVPRR